MNYQVKNPKLIISQSPNKTGGKDFIVKNGNKRDMKIILILLICLVCPACTDKEMSAPFCEEINATEFKEIFDVPDDFSGPIKICSPNGKIQIKGLLKKGMRTGLWLEYFNDQLIEQSHFKEGELHGRYESYYQNGQKKKDLHYYNGKLDKSYMSFYQNGQLEVEAYYVNGELDKNYQSYFENGQLKLKTQYLDRKLHGKNIHFYENGQTKIDYNYINGKLNGDCLLYNIKGRLQRKENYKNGILKKCKGKGCEPNQYR
jgi:antitoxin component YwqK of YwqJK toxin-antitoxin module